MIAGGIAVERRLHDDCSTMMSQSGATLQQRGSVGFAICEADALAERTRALLGELRDGLAGAFATDAGDVHRVDADELERLGALGDEVAELASQMAFILARLPREPLAVNRREIADAARTALADGIADHRRACAIASLLTVEQGFPALAEALIDSDAHGCWDARVVEVLAAFRDVDETRARQVAALGGVPETARFDELRPERVLELAHTLRQLAGR